MAYFWGMSFANVRGGGCQIISEEGMAEASFSEHPFSFEGEVRRERPNPNRFFFGVL